MILRLRQICGHILLVQGTVMDLLEREDFEKLNKITETEDEMSEEGADLLVHLRNVLKHNLGVKTIEGGIQGAVISENETVPVGVVDEQNPEGQVGGKHGLSFRFRKYLDSLVNSEQWGVIAERTLCSGCRQKVCEKKPCRRHGADHYCSLPTHMSQAASTSTAEAVYKISNITPPGAATTKHAAQSVVKSTHRPSRAQVLATSKLHVRAPAQARTVHQPPVRSPRSRRLTIVRTGSG
jgi:hypothetical protein